MDNIKTTINKEIGNKENKRIQELLLFRSLIKSKKPNFLRQDAHKLKRLEKKWVSPKGEHSRMRKKIKGHRRQPSIGFSSPKLVRGLTSSGYRQVLVSNVKDLLNVKGAFILSGKLGSKKKLEILKKALDLKLKVLNIKDPASYIAQIESSLKSRKEEKSKKIQEKEKAKKESLKKAEEKAKEKKGETPEEKEKSDKEEKRKVLEKK